MESPRSSPASSARRHVRNISHPMPQRATRGPLEDVTNDPLADPPPPPPVAGAVSEDRKTGTPHLAELAPRPQMRPGIDLRFLQDRQRYHSVTTEDIPSAFLNSPHRPPVDTPLSQLIQHGHYRRAAEQSLRSLLQSPPTAAEQIFQLLYTRLACLVLISRPDIAAAEAMPLIEVTSRNSPGSQHVVELIPWPLRLLLIRLQTIGAADGGRRGVMALYSLAGEVRANLRLAQRDEDVSASELWNSRLRDLGLRVADALVELGELDTALRHLDSLVDIDLDHKAYRQAILHFRVGDARSAQQCALSLQHESKREEIEALFKVGEGDHSGAVACWQKLCESSPHHEHFALNTAVALLYNGHIADAQSTLERLVQEVPAFATALFNLSTVYELCTERAPEKKIALVQHAATQHPHSASGGWERATFDFKL